MGGGREHLARGRLQSMASPGCPIRPLHLRQGGRIQGQRPDTFSNWAPFKPELHGGGGGVLINKMGLGKE